jgi:hypothetical protein
MPVMRARKIERGLHAGFETAVGVDVEEDRFHGISPVVGYGFSQRRRRSALSNIKFAPNMRGGL